MRYWGQTVLRVGGTRLFTTVAFDVCVILNRSHSEVRATVDLVMERLPAIVVYCSNVVIAIIKHETK